MSTPTATEQITQASESKPPTAAQLGGKATTVRMIENWGTTKSAGTTTIVELVTDQLQLNSPNPSNPLGERLTVAIGNIPSSLEDTLKIQWGYFVVAQHLLNTAEVKKGDKVLILEADAPIGYALLQLARRIGAEVVAGASIKWHEHLFPLGVSSTDTSIESCQRLCKRLWPLGAKLAFFDTASEEEEEAIACLSAQGKAYAYQNPFVYNKPFQPKKGFGGLFSLFGKSSSQKKGGYIWDNNAEDWAKTSQQILALHQQLPLMTYPMKNLSLPADGKIETLISQQVKEGLYLIS